MDCSESKKKLALLLDELLEAEEARDLEIHLSVCTTCKEEEKRLAKLFSLSTLTEAPAPSPEVWLKIRSALRKSQPLPWSERLRQAAERAGEAFSRYLPGYAAGAASAALFLIVFFPARIPPNEKESRLQPVQEAGLVSNPMTARDGYPIRYVGVGPKNPQKRYLVRDGQLLEVDNPPARPSVDYPVREIGNVASLKTRDF